MEVIDDTTPPQKGGRLAFCTEGSIMNYWKREKIADSDLILIRIEQLYPLDEKRVGRVDK